MLAVCGLRCGLAFTPTPLHTQVRNPCSVVTKTEVEALVGGRWSARSAMLPDVAADAGFLAQLRPDAQRQFGFDPRTPGVATAAQAMKNGCSDHTAAAAAQGEATAMETYCRCIVDAAVVSGLPEAEMRAIAAAFGDRSLTQASERYPKFAAYRSDCLH